MGIGLVILIPSIFVQVGVKESWMQARAVERAEADASFMTPLVISWIGIGLGTAWVLAAVTCYFIPGSVARLQRPPEPPRGSGAVV